MKKRPCSLLYLCIYCRGWNIKIRDAFYFSESLEFGMVGINEWAPHATEAPFIGWKQSGIGAESGSEGLFEYMEKKLVSWGGL